MRYWAYQAVAQWRKIGVVLWIRCGGRFVTRAYWIHRGGIRPMWVVPIDGVEYLLRGVGPIATMCSLCGIAPTEAASYCGTRTQVGFVRLC
jgi:hypothetical protein